MKMATEVPTIWNQLPEAMYLKNSPTADGNGMRAYHTFFLEKTSEGCHIITEEVVKGRAPSSPAKSSPARCTGATSFG